MSHGLWLLDPGEPETKEALAQRPEAKKALAKRPNAKEASNLSYFWTAGFGVVGSFGWSRCGGWVWCVD